MFTKEFEDYLKSNYHEPKDRQVFVEVGNFLLQNPVPAEIDDQLDIRRIKFLTKIVSHSVDDDFVFLSGVSYDSNIIESAIRYCNAGIERVKSGRVECKSEALESENVVKMHGHLYSHMGKLEHILSMRTDDIDEKKKLLLAAKEHFAECIRICEPVEKEHPAYQFSYKAKAALRLTDICAGNERYALFLEAAQDFAEGSRRSESFNPTHSAYTYTFAADHFYNAALIAPDDTARNKHLVTAVELARKGAEMAKEKNPKHWAITYGNIGKFAEALYELTGDPLWKITAIQSYTTLKEYLHSTHDGAHIINAMHAKICTLREDRKPIHAREKSDRKVETKFIKRGNEGHKVRRHIDDELKDLDY
jgi:hypothetical protein